MNVRRGGRGAGGDLGCAQVEELAPDLALGLLDGAARAAVLAHVERCASCRAEVTSLTEVGDNLLLLAPEAPPPPGFESRVLTHLAPEQRQRQRRRRRHSRAIGTMAAATVLIVAGVVAAVARDGGQDGPSAPTTTAPAGDPETGNRTEIATTDLRTNEGDVVGEVVLREIHGMAAVEVDMDEWLDQMAAYGQPVDVDGPWWLHVEGPNGFHEMHDLALGSGPAEVTLDGSVADVGSVAIVDVNGRTWCWGDFA